MKKALLIGSLGVFGVIALASCKKDYTCDCTVNGGNITVQIKDAKKKDATDVCDQAQVTYSIGGTASCTLND